MCDRHVLLQIAPIFLNIPAACQVLSNEHLTMFAHSLANENRIIETGNKCSMDSRFGVKYCMLGAVPMFVHVINCWSNIPLAIEYLE